MTRGVLLVLLVTVATGVVPSPFQLTDQYVEDFKEGIQALKKLAHDHVFTEVDFNPDLYNRSEALKEAVEYDFVIIGAGAAGSVLATRLSEKPEWKVLLLEAGGPETEITRVPRLGYYLKRTPYNWAYVTPPQKTWCKGMIDSQCVLEGGKALGGSTAINGMMYTRGNAKDYDQWADQGNDGWCYDDVLPYFKKAEDASLDHFDHDYHNHGGPFHVEHPQYQSELTDNVLNAGKDLGLDIVDYNGKEQLGVGKIQLSTKHGKRQSTAKAYLEPATKRPNLTIKPLSHVLRILISPHTKEASGVEFLHGDQLHVAKARKEVILSAGAINTAQLLKLSGVGPKDELLALDIPLVNDLRVGQGLKDHVSFVGLDFVYNDNVTTSHDSKDYDEVIDYLKNGKGPLTGPGCEAISYVKTEASKDPSKHYPDVELFFLNKQLSSDPGLNIFRIKKEIHESLWKPVEGKHAINIGVMLAHPKSHGTVTLKDKDPLHRPIVDLNHLSDPDDHDIKTLLAGIKKAIAFAETPTLKKLVTINTSPISGCEGHKWGTDDYWKCSIRHLSISLRHVTGTAKMGPETDKEAVVDNQLRVHGVHKLRVADASIIPVTITGHTMAPSIMVGEKASDLIKEAWK